MKTKFFLLAKVLFLSILFTTTACSKGDSDDGGNDGHNTTIADPEGTVTANIRNSSSGGYGHGELKIYDNPSIYLYMDYSNNFSLDPSNVKIRSIGKVSGLGSIKNIPIEGYASKTAVEEGYGYVIKVEKNDYSSIYARIYVERFLASGSSIAGAQIKYQCPFIVKNETPLSEAIKFQWEKMDNPGTGLAIFGLQWIKPFSPTEEPICITKNDASKLVQLSSDAWSTIKTQESLKSAIITAQSLSKYTPSLTFIENSTIYSDILGVAYNNRYFMIKVEKGTISTTVVDTQIVITGQYKVAAGL